MPLPLEAATAGIAMILGHTTTGTTLKKRRRPNTKMGTSTTAAVFANSPSKVAGQTQKDITSPVMAVTTGIAINGPSTLEMAKVVPGRSGSLARPELLGMPQV